LDAGVACEVVPIHRTDVAIFLPLWHGQLNVRRGPHEAGDMLPELSVEQDRDRGQRYNRRDDLLQPAEAGFAPADGTGLSLGRDNVLAGWALPQSHRHLRVV
jgi:hypothetical protein